MRCLEAPETLTWDGGAPWERFALVAIMWIPMSFVFFFGLPILVLICIPAAVMLLSALLFFHRSAHYSFKDQSFLLEHRFGSYVWKERRLRQTDVSGLNLLEVQKWTSRGNIYYEYTIGLRTSQGEIVPTVSSQLLVETLTVLDRLAHVTGLPILPYPPLKNPKA